MWKQVSSVLNMTMEEIRASRNVLVNVFNPQHRVLFWNRKCEEVFGVLEKDALGKRLEEIVPHAHGNDKLVHLKRALAGHPVHILNDKFDKIKGYYEQQVLPIRDGNGTVIAALNVVKTVANKVAQ